MRSELPPTEKPEEREALDPETLAALEEGIRSEQTGRSYTWEEVKEFARERRKEWTIVPKKRSA
jgi:hypothetical protein